MRRPARSSTAWSSARPDRRPTASAQASAPSATRSPTTLYRSPAGTNTWTLVASRTRGANDPTDDGSDPIELTLTDAVATGTAGAPPTANAAALAPYAQNPNFLAGVTAAGITDDASDASKAYPSTPTVLSSPPLPAGATFFDGGVQAVPRYPSNVYYNASRQAQQLDEYNWIYVSPPAGGCVPIAGVTTCRTTPATWAEYVASENRVMFRHVVDNDPRPHYIHQSNLADYNPALPETEPGAGRHRVPGVRRPACPLRGELRSIQRAAGATHPRRRSARRSRSRTRGRRTAP